MFSRSEAKMAFQRSRFSANLIFRNPAKKRQRFPIWDDPDLRFSRYILFKTESD